MILMKIKMKIITLLAFKTSNQHYELNENGTILKKRTHDLGVLSKNDLVHLDKT